MKPRFIPEPLLDGYQVEVDGKVIGKVYKARRIYLGTVYTYWRANDNDELFSTRRDATAWLVSKQGLTL